MKVVGIGASAGGVEALRRFLSNLPTNTGAAFVVVQHLSPDFKSIMAELLQRFTAMPVQELTEDILPESNHIYLMPGNKTISIQFGMLKLYDREPKQKLNLPIDKFFHSLGMDAEENAIGVILSGSGTDGSRGARTIKEKAGIVLVQSLDSAEFTGMPNSLIQLDIADDILPPEELANKLGEVIKLDRGSKKSIKQGEESIFYKEKDWFQKIIQHVSQESDIDFTEYKIATLQRRIEKKMIIHRHNTLENYYTSLRENEEETDVLARDFLISVTRFFRDTEFFQVLREKIIPTMFSRLKSGEVCRIWITACSTGEEAYGIGILISEYLKSINSSQDFKIFASDVNKKSIEIASRGIYFPNILADVPLSYMEAYFKKEGNSYQVKTGLREKIIFAVHNVIKDAPFIKMHLISCRNFLIYLKLEAQLKVLKTFYFSLKENHHLALGPSESLGQLSQVFKSVNRTWNIFEKEANTTGISRSNYRPPTQLWHSNSDKNLVQKDLKGSRDINYLESKSDPFSEYLVEQYAPTTLIVNEDLDILYLNGNWENILSLPKAMTKMNLERMLPHDNVLNIYDGMRLVDESDEIHVLKNVIFKKKDILTHTDLAFEKVKIPETDKLRISITLVEAQKGKNSQKRQLEEVREVNLTAQNYDQERTIRLEKELKALKNSLIEAEKKTEFNKEKLHKSNQNLLSTNEELQSTNEELQSLNEELHTVNTELQMKNKQLAAVSSDISNLLRTTNIGTIFLDKNLRIRRFTSAITRQVDLIETDINRPISAFTNKLKNIALETLCREVMQTNKFIEREVDSKNGRRYLLRIFPYRTEENVELEGVVITLIDINEISQDKGRLRELGILYQEVINNTKLTILHLNPDNLITFASQNLNEYQAEEMVGRQLFEIISGTAGDKLEDTLKSVKENQLEEIYHFEIKKKSKSEFFTFRIIPIIDKVDTKKLTSFVILAESKKTL